MHEQTLRVSDVAQALGVPVPTIRSWEKRYEWPNPPRTHGGHRRYSSLEVEQIRALRDEIARGRSAQQAVFLLRRMSERRQARFVERLSGAAARMDGQEIRRVLDEAQAALSPEEVVQGVVWPALREIGLGWQNGWCDVAGEHLATGHVRRWLGDALEQSRPASSSKRIVLATGPADFHSVGLESFALLLARRDCDPLVLGALTPSSSLVTAVTQTNAKAAVITSHMSVTRRAAVESIRAVEGLGGTAVFFAGNAFNTAASRQGVPATYLGVDPQPAAALVVRQMAGANTVTD